MPRIYKDFKEAISIRFNTNQHPAPQFEKMAAAFARLGAITVGTGANAPTLAIRPQLQALIAMSTLPQKWEHLIPVMCNNMPVADLKLSTVSACVESQYETEANRGQHKAAHNAQKLSAVKRKRNDPRFSKQGSSQQQSSASGPSNQQQPFRQRGGRGSRRGKPSKGKGKAPARAPQHSHVASVAALVPPTTHKVTHIGSSGVSTRTEVESSSPQRTPGFFPSFNKALTLAEWLDVPATVQTVKTLEQRFADVDTQMQPRINQFMDEEYDSDFNIDMSQQPLGSAQPIMNTDGLDDMEIFGEPSNALQLDLSGLTISDGASDKENRAPTPPYVDPASIVEATVRWATTGESRFRRSRSNERIEQIWRSNQQYLKDNGKETDPRFDALVSPSVSIG
jgi:hypothetical protein